MSRKGIKNKPKAPKTIAPPIAGIKATPGTSAETIEDQVKARLGLPVVKRPVLKPKQAELPLKAEAPVLQVQKSNNGIAVKYSIALTLSKNYQSMRLEAGIELPVADGETVEQKYAEAQKLVDAQVEKGIIEKAELLKGLDTVVDNVLGQK